MYLWSITARVPECIGDFKRREMCLNSISKMNGGSGMGSPTKGSVFRKILKE